jgi:hypothetical protein
LKKIVSKKIWPHGIMEAFADAVGVRAFGFGARVVDVLDREIELANGRATLRAKFASSIPRARHSPSCAENGSNPEATMSNTKRFAIVASVGIVSLGSITSQAQQQPPQSPNMTFFVTSTGPGKGADLGGLEGADR